MEETRELRATIQELLSAMHLAQFSIHESIELSDGKLIAASPMKDVEEMLNTKLKKYRYES